MHDLPAYHSEQIARTNQPETITAYIDIATGEIVKVRRMPKPVLIEQPSAGCNCPYRRPHRRPYFSKWRKQLIENVGLVGVLGLVLVVMLEMGR
jgi:hypothetical protein